MLSRVVGLLERGAGSRRLTSLRTAYVALREARWRVGRSDGSIRQPRPQGLLPRNHESDALTPKNEIARHKFAKVARAPTRISIIYNYFKKDATVFQSLESIEQQSWRNCRRSDVEIILIDDGSPGHRIETRIPHDVLYLWQRKEGYGICKAKNTGARLANGEFLVFLDPDILLDPDYLDAMLDGFRTFGNRVVQCAYIWDYHFAGCLDPRTEFGVWEHPGRATARFYQVAGGNMAIPRSLFFETPGFDEDLIYGGVEDLLFGYHLSKLKDTAVVFNQRMQSHHIPHPPSGAHADPRKSWEVVHIKWPQFYEDYVEKGLR